MTNVVYRSWPAGMDNRSASHDLSRKPEAAVLRDALNVDILSSGKPRMRPGRKQVRADTGAHSLFTDSNRLVWATSSALKVGDENHVPTTVLSDSRLVAPLSWVALNGELYFSNEAINGKLVSYAYEPWGVAAPAYAPVCTPATSGEYRYTVTCTFVTATGEESGAPLGSTVLCGEIPSLRLTSIPQSSDGRVVATRLYVTNVDGKDFYAQVDVPAGTTAWSLTGFFANGALLRTQFLEPLPPGQLIEYNNGRMYAASSNILWYTEPLRYGLMNRAANFFVFPARITLVKGVKEGLYISADRTYFLPGAGTKDVDLVVLEDDRAVEGAVLKLPGDGEEVVWLSTGGIRRGKGGAMERVTDDRIAIEKYERACVGLVEKNGHRAIVVVARDGAANPLVADDFVI